jgi:hypothetical protein
MSNLVGGAQPSKIMAGDAPVQKVYVGKTYAWPTVPTSTVTWVGSKVAAGTTNTFPTHKAGDLLVVVATEYGPYTAPPCPSGYTSAYSNNTGIAIQIGWKIATAAGTSVGGWSGAYYNCVYVFRGANTTTPFGGIISSTGSGPGISGPTLQDTSGDSLLCYGYSNNGTTGTWGARPDGYIDKNTEARLGNLQRIDSRTAPAASWSINVGAANWRNWAFEVLPA